MDVREKLVELLRVHPCSNVDCEKCGEFQDSCWLGKLADKLIAHGVTVQDEPIKFVMPEGVDEKQLKETLRNAHLQIFPGEPVHEWISVEDRLPEEGEDVLIFGYWHEKYQPLKGYLSPHHKGEWFTSVAGHEVYSVTHWMPLPQPPKGE